MAKKIGEDVQGILHKSKGVRKNKEKVVNFTAQESIPDTVNISQVKTPGNVWEKKGYTGKDIAIAVIGPGRIDPQHPDIKGRVVSFKDFVGGEPVEILSGDICGAIVAGIAANELAANRKVLGKLDGTTSEVIKGIQWAIKHKKEYGIKVLSIPPAAQEDLISSAIERAAKAGIVVVASQGNEGP